MRDIEASEIQNIAGGGKGGIWGRVLGGLLAAEEAYDNAKAKVNEKVANGDWGPANDNNTNAMGDTY